MKPSWWRDGLGALFGAASPADRALQERRRDDVARLSTLVAQRDRVEDAILRAGHGRRIDGEPGLAVAGALATYAERLGLVEPRLRLHVDVRVEVTLFASRYEREKPSLRRGCPEFVRAVEDAVGASVHERFEPC